MLARTFTLALIASLAATGLAWDRDGEDIRVSFLLFLFSSRSLPYFLFPQFAQIKKIDDDKFKKTKFNVHDATVHNKNFNQVENKDKDVLKAVAFRKNDDDDFKLHHSKHRRFDDGKKHGGIYKRWDDDDKGHGRKFDGKDRKHFGGHRKKGDDDDFKHRRFGDGKKHGGIFKRGVSPSSHSLPPRFADAFLPLSPLTG
ncbi:hypothetical protein BCR35DRAFT_69143 [Leucosporidium creatinivorum]|uniref:Uncharacterized protein n=1 Tax=Leucosporidium creatinivorum TaxID=106004 RepID=A0A1Y2G6A4_9BASI|nr:hypothetical protein BCR35DRAFT_69143 [Leucosporidium creatinivorum]